MKSLASLSINYHNYRVIMPNYSGRFFLMDRLDFIIDNVRNASTPSCDEALLTESSGVL